MSALFCPDCGNQIAADDDVPWALLQAARTNHNRFCRAARTPAPPLRRTTSPITHIRKDTPPMNTLQAVPRNGGRPPAAALAGHDDKRIARAAQKVLDAEAALDAAWEQHSERAALRAKRDRLKKQLAEIEAELKGAPVVQTAASKVDSKAVRAWAAENGYDVAPAGIIPKAIVAAYQAATGGGAA